VRPIFAETTSTEERVPSATAEELANAMAEVLEAGARIVNLSVALVQPSARGERELQLALDYAAQKGAIVVAAAGNQGTLGSTVITRHPWVVPVVAYDLRGRPMALSNLGGSIGRRGVGAPGERITSLKASGGTLTLQGTSAAAPFVTGTTALLWSCFPSAGPARIKLAIRPGARARRNAITPPMLDAWLAYRAMATG
jgi:subtilisin family serine protease